MGRLVFLAALWSAPIVARADDGGVVADFRAAAQTQRALAAKPAGPCAAPAAGAGRTEFYDGKQNLLFAAAGGCREDAIVVLVDEKQLSAFKRASATRCAAGTALDPCGLRAFGQAYAIAEYIAFDSRRNRVALGNGLLFETKTYLYLDPEDGLIHTGREKLVGSPTDVLPTDPNHGGNGYKGQTQERSLSDLHTHPNSGVFLTSGSQIGVARHHPSDADTDPSKLHDYFDVVVSPLFVYFINNRHADTMVFSRQDPFGANPVKEYLAKDREADAYYHSHRSYPAWYHDYADKNNPWHL